MGKRRRAAMGLSSYLGDMETTEKILMVVCLFGGFMWIRTRTRSMDLSKRRGRTVVGIFGVLPALLIGEKYLFESLEFGGYTGMLFRAALAAATFAAVGYLFLKPGSPGPEPEEAGRA